MNPTPEYPADSRPNRTAQDIALAALGVIFGLLVILTSTLLFSGRPAPPLLATVLPATLLSTAVIGLLRPRWIFYSFIPICMAFPHELEEFFLPLPFMKLYPQDVVFVFLIGVCIVRLLTNRSRSPLHSIPFNRYMYLYMMVGLVAAGIGLFVTGNSYSNVFGDLRRSFFYFLAYFFCIILTRSESDIRHLTRALLIGATLAITRGLWQATSGAFEARRFTDAAHVLNHFEITFSTFAIYYGLTRLALRDRRFWWWIALVVAGILIVVLGNFRTCWVGFAAGLAVLVLFLPWHYRKKLLLAAITLGIIGSAALALIWQVPVKQTHSTIGQNIAEKANISNILSDTNITWRMDSYRNAMNLWERNKLFGRGLGEHLEFATTTSTGGAMMAMGHRVHNSYLWFLMSLGVVGLSIVAAIHCVFLRHVVTYLRFANHAETQARMLVLSCLALYVTILVSACFDVYLESGPPITILSVTMAIILLTISATPPAPAPATSIR